MIPHARPARRGLTGMFAIAIAAGVPAATHAEADGPDFYRVVGVAADDMLNLRRGPGMQFETIVGLPAGREVNLLSRETYGTTDWCLIALRETPDLQGFVACRFIGE